MYANLDNVVQSELIFDDLMKIDGIEDFYYCKMFNFSHQKYLCHFE